jgi:tetratricopeptide (TPR) repeat protein
MESASRRLGMALTAVAAAGLLLRGEISGALVVRGDEMLVRNDYRGASARYLRALAFAPDSDVAVDRLLFAAMQDRSPAMLSEGISIASRYLRDRPASATVLFDRGLSLLLVKAYRRAFFDFRAAAIITGDPQQFVFAGWAAKRAGSPGIAIALWKRAIALRHRYRPALLALKEMKR